MLARRELPCPKNRTQCRRGTDLVINDTIPDHLTKRVMLYQVPRIGAGTCFVLDHDGKRYIATSNTDTNEITEFSVLNDREWRDVDVELVGLDERLHVSVWAPTSLLPILIPRVEYDTEDWVGLGRSVYAIGFALLQDALFQVVTQGIVAFSSPDQPQFLVDTKPTHMMQGGLIAAQSVESDMWTICGMIFDLVHSDGPEGPDESMAGFMRAVRTEAIRSLIENNPIGQPIGVDYGEWESDESD